VANLQQPDDAGNKLPAELAPAEMTAKGAGRRRFAKAGLGVSAGAIVTLASQPAMAQALSCTSPSGMRSSNLSRNHQHVPCAGRSSGFWAEHPEAWPGAQTSTDAQFNAVFTTGTFRTTLLAPYTMMEVLKPKDIKQDKVKGQGTVDADPDNVAKHIVATLLNVRSGRIGFLTENQVTGIWNSYALDGTYQPVAGETWNGAQIADYLQKTMVL
jgi:hypothetical protein